MNIIKAIIFVGVLVLGTPAFADGASEKEAAKLLNIMGMESALRESMSQMLDIQLQQNPSLAPYKGVMMEFFEKHMSYESLKPELINIYSEAFTASELQKINAFYTTDVGQKTIQKMPELMAKGGQIGAARVQANIQELQAMIKAEAERIEQLQQQ